MMGAITEKVSMAQWILSLTDEEVIHRVSKSLEVLRRELEGEPTLLDGTRYSEMKNKEFDFERIKAERNIQPLEKGELDQLIKDADIQESIDVLLASID